MTNDHFKPRLQQALQSLRLDLHYHRAAGNYLYYQTDTGQERAVLDLVGGYGSLLLGHNHPALVAEAHRLLDNQCAFHAQASRREPARRLARALAERAGGDYLSVFANSGAEAVEIALKHAMLQTGSRTFIALSGGFHGKTLAALQLTANSEFRDPFQLSGLKVIRVSIDDMDALDRAFDSADDLGGFIYEPILGEGGVFPLSAAFVQRAAARCAERGAPLIADECQTGMGRTGTFLASTALGVQPDYVILSKSLGGGLAKISATLIQRAHYRDELDLQHTSTYAEDDFSCALAWKVLELLDARALNDCQAKGARLLIDLQGLARRFPTVIAEARGRGLLLGVELRPRSLSSSFLLRIASDGADLGYLVTAYLLHTHQIRVAPTLSQPLMLRLQPSLLLEQHEHTRLVSALEEVCQRLQAEDGVGLVRPLGNTPAPLPSTGAKAARLLVYDRRIPRLRRPAPTIQVAWLCHPVHEADLVSLEPGAAVLTGRERENLMGRLALRGGPVLVSSRDIESIAGARLRFHAIMLPFTSRWAWECLRQGGNARPLIQSGVDLAARLGCQLVSLGQYTSILTCNGLKLDTRGMGLTTGNSYAVALARQAVERARQERGGSTLVVVGATGNIGRACSHLFAPAFRRAWLIGSTRPGSAQRLNRLAASLPNARVATHLGPVAEGDVVVLALNAVDAPLAGHHFGPGAVICDLSVPSGLQSNVNSSRPDLTLFKGGLAWLPKEEDLGIVGYPLPLGQVYACMAEGVVLGWENVRTRQFTGSISAAHVDLIESMAARHGFTLADYRLHEPSERRMTALAS